MCAMTEELTAYQRHYRKDPEKHKRRVAERTKRVRREMQEYIDDVRNQAACADCGKSYPGKPWRMSFDHLPEFTKAANVSDCIRLGWGKAKVDAEIAKCEIVCLLCHADRTYSRRVSGATGAQRTGNQEVAGSNPARSTHRKPRSVRQLAS